MATFVSPFRGIDDVYRPFEGLFGNSVGLADRAARWLPATDISKTETEYRIDMDVPGYTRDQISVEVHEGVLSVDGEMESERESDKEGWVQKERRTGKFARRFNLPDGTLAEDISAEVNHGVLTITIPHTSPAGPTTVEVR